jgi:hypothetical protein
VCLSALPYRVQSNHLQDLRDVPLFDLVDHFAVVCLVDLFADLIDLVDHFSVVGAAHGPLLRHRESGAERAPTASSAPRR